MRQNQPLKRTTRHHNNRHGNNNSHSNSNRKPHAPNKNQHFDSRGPNHMRIKGTAQQICEKYITLSMETPANDRRLAENFRQHAEHYQRIAAEINTAHEAEQQKKQKRRDEEEAQQETPSAQSITAPQDNVVESENPVKAEAPVLKPARRKRTPTHFNEKTPGKAASNDSEVKAFLGEAVTPAAPSKTEAAATDSKKKPPLSA